MLSGITTTLSAPEPTTAGATANLRACFVDRERSPADVATVQSGDRGIRFAAICHFDEAEPSRPAGVAVRHYCGALNRAVWLKPLPQVSVTGGKREVSNKYLFHAHSLNSGFGCLN
jgi:hypothetical protein